MAATNAGGGNNNSGAVRAGRAFVEITADDSKLKSAFASIEKYGTATIRRLNQLFKIGLIGAAGGFAAGIAAAAASLFTAAERLDATAKAADRLGTTTEELSALAYAAGQSGSSIEDVEKAVFRLQKSLAEAKDETSKAAENFAKLGLSADFLAGRDLVEQIAIIAERLNGLSDANERAAIGSELLGKGIKELFPLLKGGYGALFNLREEAERVGGIVKDEDARRAERFGDTLSRAGMAVKTAFQQIGIELLSGVGLVEKMGDGVVNLAGKIRGWTKDAANWVRTEFALVFETLETITGLVSGGEFSKAFEVLKTGIEAAWLTAVAAIEPFFDDWTGNLRNALDMAFTKGANAISLAVQGIRREFDEATDLRNRISRLGSKGTFGPAGFIYSLLDPAEQKVITTKLEKMADGTFKAVTETQMAAKQALDRLAMFNRPELFSKNTPPPGGIVTKGPLSEALAKTPPPATQVVSTARGAFLGGSNAAQALGGGFASPIVRKLDRLENVENKQLDELKKIAGSAGVVFTQ